MTCKRLEDPRYAEDVSRVACLPLDWSPLDGRTVAISGATGMVGTFLVDVLMWRQAKLGKPGRVIALGRSEQKARLRLPFFGEEGFAFERYNVNAPGALPSGQADLVLHLASTTHPRAYATDPIGTITSNVMGLQNLLEYACRRQDRPARFLFASSVEVYGENRGDAERFSEDYLGYLNCNTLRAGYPEAKRLGEALCQAYASQRDVEVYLPRLPRTYGPTMLQSDTKAISQFIKRGVAGDDIVLKSEGTQLYSYQYVADTVAGILWVLLRGDAGVAYNIADSSSDITLRNLAELIAKDAGTSVSFDLPDEVERAGYSTATKAMLDGTRLERLGWSPAYDIAGGIGRTMAILRGMASPADAC